MLSTTRLNKKISLNSEGILLRCIHSFAGRPRKISANAWVAPQVEKENVVLFLGCWHYEMQIRTNPSSKPLKHKFKRTVWTTSLRFLNEQTIVKIDWVGIGKLEQLFQASKFIYTHFQLVDG